MDVSKSSMPLFVFLLFVRVFLLGGDTRTGSMYDSCTRISFLEVHHFFRMMVLYVVFKFKIRINF